VQPSQIGGDEGERFDLRRVEDALADCIEVFLKGEAGFEATIERYPEHKDELLALLNVVSSLRCLPEDIGPSPAWRRQTKAAILAKITGEQSGD